MSEVQSNSCFADLMELRSGDLPQTAKVSFEDCDPVIQTRFRIGEAAAAVLAAGAVAADDIWRLHNRLSGCRWRNAGVGASNAGGRQLPCARLADAYRHVGSRAGEMFGRRGVDSLGRSAGHRSWGGDDCFGNPVRAVASPGPDHPHVGDAATLGTNNSAAGNARAPMALISALFRWP